MVVDYIREREREREKERERKRERERENLYLCGWFPKIKLVAGAPNPVRSNGTDIKNKIRL